MAGPRFTVDVKFGVEVKNQDGIVVGSLTIGAQALLNNPESLITLKRDVADALARLGSDDDLVPAVVEAPAAPPVPVPAAITTGPGVPAPGTPGGPPIDPAAVTLAPTTPPGK